MPDQLRINGIPIALLVEGHALDAPVEIGEATRAFDGTGRRSRLAIKNTWRGQAVHQGAADALALRSLLLGLGHHASWDANLYTAKGLPPNPTTGLTVEVGAPKVGAGHLRAAANNPVRYASYAAQLGAAWTVMVWRKVGAGAWASYVVTSGGKKWVDGSRNDGASTTWLTVTAGTVRLDGDLASTVDYDDGVMLPYVIPDAWGPTYHTEGTAGRAWGDLPRLRAEGRAIYADAVAATVLGSVGQATIIAASFGGVWTPNLHVLPFTLEEV